VLKEVSVRCGTWKLAVGDWGLSCSDYRNNERTFQNFTARHATFHACRTLLPNPTYQDLVRYAFIKHPSYSLPAFRLQLPLHYTYPDVSASLNHFRYAIISGSTYFRGNILNLAHGPHSERPREENIYILHVYQDPAASGDRTKIWPHSDIHSFELLERAELTSRLKGESQVLWRKLQVYIETG
jgi:hypothetical protein